MNRAVTIASGLIAVALVAAIVFEFAAFSGERADEVGEMSARPVADLTGALPPTAVPQPVRETVSDEPRDVSAFALFSGRSNPGAALSGSYEAATVEDILALGLEAIGASPTHIAFR